VADPPAQILLGFATAKRFKDPLPTVTAIVCEALQTPLLPVTLYTPDRVGLITSKDPVAPVFQL
jgi:hypothetical protein